MCKECEQNRMLEKDVPVEKREIVEAHLLNGNDNPISRRWFKRESDYLCVVEFEYRSKFLLVREYTRIFRVTPGGQLGEEEG